MSRSLFNRRIALPADHGTWAFFVSPLVIGLFAGGSWRTTSAYLVAAATSGFLLRQPITTLVKVVSRRRSKKDAGPALFWSCLYLGLALLHLLGLFLRGYGFVLILALPGVAVFCWYLLLIARRDERRQKGVEILGAGVLALSAPAAYWIGIEWLDPRGWLLWGLCWIQSAMSIEHVYVRLEQRRAGEVRSASVRRLSLRTLAINSVLLAIVGVASATTTVPALIAAPFLLQWGESAQAAFSSVPAPQPAAIGVRQLVVSTIFTALFIVIWS